MFAYGILFSHHWSSCFEDEKEDSLSQTTTDGTATAVFEFSALLVAIYYHMQNIA